MNLVNTDWLEKNLDKVKIFDASWHMPSSKRNAKKEYGEKHIKGAIFWDVDEHSDKDSPYPHMMSNSDYWARMLQSFRIKNNDHIVVYDYSDTYSSCRLWFALKYFGHQCHRDEFSHRFRFRRRKRPRIYKVSLVIVRRRHARFRHFRARRQIRNVFFERLRVWAFLYHPHLCPIVVEAVDVVVGVVV